MPDEREIEKPRGLVVDDDDEIREIVARWLGLWGWDADEAADGTSGMAKFWGAVSGGRPYRLIVMDVAMAGMDGLTTSERIRRVERERGMGRSRIVGLTAYGAYMVSEEALQRADFDALLTKPVSPDRLRAACEEARGGSAGG